MMRKLGSLAIALAIVPSLLACGEDAPDSSVSGVFPSSAFLGRQARIEISGDVTTWEAPTVSFGEGVTVDAVNVASPTALFVDVTIAPTATAGLRTVTVTDGSETLELTDAFELEAPVRVRAQGTLAQGSVVILNLENRDFDAPFDTTSIPGEGIFDPPTFVGVTLQAPTGVTLDVSDVQPYSVSALALIDVSAGSGPLTVTSGVDVAAQIVSPVDGFDIAPRTATALTSGTAAMGMIEASYATGLYEFSPAAAPMISSLAVLTDNAMAAPNIVLLGESGSFDELLDFSPFVISNALPSKVYAIVWDNSGYSGYSYELLAGSRTFTTVAEAAANETAATAQAPAIPAIVTATLSSADDEDWVKITATAGDVGKRIFAATVPGDQQADTVLEFYTGATGGTPFGAPSSDANYHESLVSPEITAAGTYFVKVTASSFQTPNTTRDGYNLVVWLE